MMLAQTKRLLGFGPTRKNLAHAKRLIGFGPAPKHSDGVPGQIPTVGYRPNDNEYRWNVLDKEFARDAPDDPCILEIGSNFGYFSLQAAKRFGQGRVFSVEGSYGTGNQGTREVKDGRQIQETDGVRKHLSLRNELELANNIVCLGVVDAGTYKRIAEAGVMFDYQISLSVFHWVVRASRSMGIDPREILADHLRAARTTFIELPDMQQRKPLPGIYREYATIPQAINEAAAAYGLGVRITYLGSSAWYGTRDTFRIDLDPAVAPRQRAAELPSERIVEILGVQVA
jgi:hypothetical protein